MPYAVYIVFWFLRILNFKAILFSVFPSGQLYDAYSSSYYIGSAEGWLMGDALERKRKEVVVA
jgi:hypothetical protein